MANQGARLCFSERKTTFLGAAPQAGRRNLCRFIPVHDEPAARQQALAIREESQTPVPVEVSAEKLDGIRESGRAGLLAIMEKNGVPMPRNGGGPYRQAPVNMELLVFQLERSGLLDADGISKTAKNMLVSENPADRKAGADLLGSIVLDSDIHRGYIRMDALMALVSRSSRSEESRATLMQFGFTSAKIEAMERLWAADKPPKPTKAEKKTAVALGIVMGAPLVAAAASVASHSALGMGVGAVAGIVMGIVESVYIANFIKTIKWNRTTKKARAELPFKALDEVDTFMRLLEPKKEFAAAKEIGDVERFGRLLSAVGERNSAIVTEREARPTLLTKIIHTIRDMLERRKEGRYLRQCAGKNPRPSDILFALKEMRRLDEARELRELPGQTLTRP